MTSREASNPASPTVFKTSKVVYDNYTSCKNYILRCVMRRSKGRSRNYCVGILDYLTEGGENIGVVFRGIRRHRNIGFARHRDSD
jgi:hypothetical protein